MERVEQKLLNIDTQKTGKIVASTFKKIMSAETTLEPAHIHYLILAAGTRRPLHETLTNIFKWVMDTCHTHMLHACMHLH